MIVTIWIADEKLIEKGKEEYAKNTGENNGVLIEAERSLKFEEKFDGEVLFNMEFEGLDIYLMMSFEDLLQIIKGFQFKPLSIDALIKALKE